MHPQGTRRLSPRLEAVVARLTTHGATEVRHQAHRRLGHQAPVRCNKVADRQGRRGGELWRRRAGGRADTAVGDAAGRMHQAGEASMDLVAHRRRHPRRVQESAPPCRPRTPLHRRALPRHRRLDARTQRHAPLYHQIRSPGHSPLHWEGADPYPRPRGEPTEGNRELRAQRLLGAEDPIPRRNVHCHREAVCLGGRGEEVARRAHPAPARNHRRGEEEGTRGSAKAVRPHVAAGGMQQKTGTLGRRDAAHHPEPIREEGYHLSACRHHLSYRRRLSQMPRDTQQPQTIPFTSRPHSRTEA